MLAANASGLSCADGYLSFDGYVRLPLPAGYDSFTIEYGQACPYAWGSRVVASQKSQSKCKLEKLDFQFRL